LAINLNGDLSGNRVHLLGAESHRIGLNQRNRGNGAQQGDREPMDKFHRVTGLSYGGNIITFGLILS
jgi:hypothetical protein